MRSRSEGCAAFCGAGSAAGDAGLQPVVGDLEGLDEIVLPRLDREPPERCLAVEPEDRGACPQVAQLDTAGDVRGDGRPVREDRDRIAQLLRPGMARASEPVGADCQGGAELMHYRSQARRAA